MTTFMGFHAGRDALQLIQAFWEALGMSTSISKPGKTSSQRSCTVLPSIQGWLCVLSSKYHMLPLYGITKKRQGRRYMLQCMSFCVRNGTQPLEKRPFSLQPRDRAALSSLPSKEAAALTPEQASSSGRVGPKPEATLRWQTKQLGNQYLMCFGSQVWGCPLLSASARVAISQPRCPTCSAGW